jgi:hypothetical protein
MFRRGRAVSGFGAFERWCIARADRFSKDEA